MNNLFTELVDLLNKDERLTSEGKLLKNKVVELAYKLDKDLIRLLLSDPKFKELFFQDVDGLLVFNQTKFQTFISNKEFLPDSFTSFKNKIGLTNENGEFISQSKEVVLSFPYKDCVLEGGQDKEDVKRDEIFYNKILASDEIDRLFEPKVLTNFKKFDKDGEHKVDAVSENDNLIIKGNNLIALHTLKKTYAGKVKLIYIDPPYNTGNDGFNYNDSFNHSTWLVFMKNRLEIARELLSEDGSIYVQLDYNEVHYGKILLDEVFGRDNFQREIIWDMTVLSGYKTLAQNWIRGHDSILFYSKNPNKFKFNKLMQPHTKEYEKMFNKTDKDGRKYMVAHGSTRYWDEIKDKGKPYGDVWNDIMSFQQQPTSGERMEFDGQKPEKLLARIIRSATDEGDLVLDFFAGTGTTGAVAHKLKRHYILIEQMDYIHDLPEDRLKDVIKGDKGGISTVVDWNGGGSFIYLELKKSNENLVTSIKGSKDLLSALRDVKQRGFLTHRIDLEKLDEKEFLKLSENEQRSLLNEILDANHLFVNLNDIDDSRFDISEEVKRLNKQFYSM